MSEISIVLRPGRLRWPAIYLPYWKAAPYSPSEDQFGCHAVLTPEEAAGLCDGLCADVHLRAHGDEFGLRGLLSLQMKGRLRPEVAPPVVDISCRDSTDNDVDRLVRELARLYAKNVSRDRLFLDRWCRLTAEVGPTVRQELPRYMAGREWTPVQLKRVEVQV